VYRNHHSFKSKYTTSQFTQNSPTYNFTKAHNSRNSRVYNSLDTTLHGYGTIGCQRSFCRL